MSKQSDFNFEAVLQDTAEDEVVVAHCFKIELSDEKLKEANITIKDCIVVSG